MLLNIIVLVCFLLVTVFPFTTNSQSLVTIAPTFSTSESTDSRQSYPTLSQYIANDSVIFSTSNTTLEFLPGEHEIDGLSKNQVVVHGVSNIIWSGKKSIINCRQEFVFVFIEVTNLILRGLKFYNCGYFLSFIEVVGEWHHIDYIWSWVEQESIKASLFLDNVVYAHIANVTIQNSTGYGLLVVDLLGKSVIDSSTFSDNSLVSDQKKEFGGNTLVIYSNVYYSFISFASLTINNSYFLSGSNNAQVIEDWKSFQANGLGLVIVGSEYMINVVIENVVFMGNTRNMAHPSVSISVYSSCQISLTISSCKFMYDGELRIKLESSEGVVSISETFVQIQNCLFSQGISTGIAIEIIGQISHLNSILIDKSTFENFRSYNTFVLPVLRIRFLKGGCPHARVKISRTVFQNNHIPTSQLWFNQPLEVCESQSCPSITIYNCTYRNNQSPKLIAYLIDISSEEYSVIECFIEHLSKWQRFEHVEILNTIFHNNHLITGLHQGVVGLTNIVVAFFDCKFINSVGSAVQATDSVVSLFNTNYFVNNTGKEGGALSLITSRLQLNENSATFLLNNTADYGGGLFSVPDRVKIKDIGQAPSHMARSVNYCLLCTLSLPNYNLANLNATVYFINNTARYSGNSVFYGAFKNCCVAPNCSEYKCVSGHFGIKTLNLTNLFVSSLKSEVELSTLLSKLFVCNSASNSNVVIVYTYPGAQFNISLKGGGDYQNVAPVVVIAKLCNDYSHIIDPGLSNSPTHPVCESDYRSEYPYGADQQLVTQECSNITYKVHSLQKKVYLEIQVRSLQGVSEWSSIDYYDFERVSVIAKINLLPCPLGYEIVNQKPNCECEEYLLRLGVKCDLNKGGKVLQPKGMWLGIYSTQFETIIIHGHCPFDYCVHLNSYFSLSSPDEQCETSRSGFLCGKCRGNLSIVLGTSNCRECSNIHLLLIIPFALAGVALVVLLLKCNLTVSVGHINGLIFYANIVHVNKPLLFQNRHPVYRVLTTFIAWLNLDLGIETCFFDGMDTYSKVWLQFVFPVYLWTMIGLIVVLAHYSSRAGKLIGSNSVPVLATLFVLSYAKLLRSVIAAVSFTYIEFEDGSPDMAVWLYDANVRYLSPKHSALFSVALLFTLCYIVPLTLLFLFSPCLQKKSHKKGLQWVNTLKPFLDSNQGPYRNRFCWWSGLFLVLRVVLYTIYALNFNNDVATSFSWTILIVAPFSFLCLFKQTVYRKKFANYLESTSLLNIVVLFLVNWYSTTTNYRNWDKIRDLASCCSIILSLILFILIMFYQVSEKLQMCKPIKRKAIDENASANDHKMSVRAPTSSVVELDRADTLLESLLNN